MIRLAVLRSPTAGRGKNQGEADAAIAALRAADLDVNVLDANTVTGALAACEDAVAQGTDALIAVGGDGTIHLAVQSAARNRIKLGIIPAGTGNDFATAVGVPASPVAAAKAIAAALVDGRVRAVDLARMTGAKGYERWFAAVLGAGFDAIVNERANAMYWPKGRRRYDLAIFAELLRLQPRHYTITLDGSTVETDANLVAVGNTSSYGGGMKMCPAADATDGLLDVVVAGPISRRALLRLQPKVYEGTHVTHPAVRSYQARVVTIDAEGIMAYADGERTCALPITITAEPGALSLLS